MKRIAILGCENSHAKAFLSFAKEKEEFSDLEFVGVYSEEAEAAQKLCDSFGVPVLPHYADAFGKIDGLIITARHGDHHYKYAKPYIDSGIPMFIDKPITICEEEALTFMRELKAKKIPICGGSSLKQDEWIGRLKQEALDEVGGKTLGGYLRAPCQSHSVYGGFYFYAQHLVEMVCEIFGRFPLSVTAKKKQNQIHVLFSYEAYDCVGLYCEKNNFYYASRMAETSATGFEIPATDHWFYKELKDFHALLFEKTPGADYREFISPVFIMNAIERSLNSGKEEAVHPFTI